MSLTTANDLDCSAVAVADPCGPRNLATVLHARVVSGSGGGPEKTILNSPRYLPGLGYRAICAYMHPPGDPGFEELREKARRWQAPLVSIPDRGPWDLRIVKQLAAVCRSERVSIWHGHDYKSNLLGLLLRRFWPMRLVTTVHGWVKHTTRTPLYYALDRLSLRHYDRVICVSPDLVDACLEAGVPREGCVLVENAIDTEEFARTRSPAEAKAALGVAADRLLIGAVGRLSAEKDFALLIRAFADLVKQGINADLWIIGEGEERQRLQQLIEQLGLKGRVRLAGYQANVVPLFEAFDMFALSSRREGLPNVLLEAMALSVPVIATRIAGVPRLVHHNRTGLLVQPCDQAALTQSLLELARFPDRRSRFGLAARRTVEECYSFAARMQKIAAIYDGLHEQSD